MLRGIPGRFKVMLFLKKKKKLVLPIYLGSLSLQETSLSSFWPCYRSLNILFPWWFMEVDFFSPITQELGFLVSKGPGSQRSPACFWPAWSRMWVQLFLASLWGTTQAVAILLCEWDQALAFCLPWATSTPSSQAGRESSLKTAACLSWEVYQLFHFRTLGQM